MKVNIVETNEKTTVEINDRLDSTTSDSVTEQLLAVVKEKIHLVLDMKECPYISSAGLRTLLIIGKKVKTLHGIMEIVNLPQEVRDVMEITGFSSIFEESGR